MCQNQASRMPPQDTSEAPQIASPLASVVSPRVVNFPVLEDFQSFQRGSVLDRIPKGARTCAASALNNVIKSACETDSERDWRKLLRFSSLCFKKPKRGGKRQPSLATTVKRQINDFLADPLRPLEAAASKQSVKRSRDKDMYAKLVAKKLANNDIKGAIRILSSDDTTLPFDHDTLSLLKEKHPVPHPDSDVVAPPDSDEVATALQLSESQVLKAIQSFPGGSAGGCDLLLPQHLKDLTSKVCGETGSQLLNSITRLSNKMLRGDIPEQMLPFLYGASLIAFSKPSGGVRPIAIGNTFRRLTAKAAALAAKEAVKTKLFPLQLGVAVPGGAEAIVHTARSYCRSNLESVDPVLLLKIDFENAFNSVRRDLLLRTARKELRDIYPFIYQCYFKPSHLFFDETTLLSAEGVQQGDPLGPMCFSLAIHGLVSRLTSELNMWYLDDGTLAGNPESVRSDFEAIIAAQDSLGLKVNVSKCEFSVLGSDPELVNTIRDSFTADFVGAKCVRPNDLSLLGTPLFQEALDPEISSRLATFKSTCTRLQSLEHHDALFLLKNVFHIPKLLYLLRTAPCFSSSILKEFDQTARSCLETITNCRLDDQAFNQASLPVKFGGLGIRRAEDICLPAFIASSFKAVGITGQLLSNEHSAPFAALLSEAVQTWKALDPRLLEPAASFKGIQKHWDLPVAELRLKGLIEGASSAVTRSRLFAVSAPGAGVWLNAVPVPSLGLKLDNESVRVSVALRLGAKLNLPYNCVCGAAVEDSATHGLDCRKAIGKHSRHSEVNDILQRALNAAGVPAHLEPVGLSRDDGKRPDGATVVPWKQGRCLVWDFTCVNTLARSHLGNSTKQAGLVSVAAEEKKKKKYASLSDMYIFTPIAVETLGPWGPEASGFLSELGRRLSAATGDPRSGAFLKQKISVAVQRGNAVCISGSFPRDHAVSEDFYT